MWVELWRSQSEAAGAKRGQPDALGDWGDKTTSLSSERVFTVPESSL
jgi:hypothetical protein